MKLFSPQEAKQQFRTKQSIDITQVGYMEKTLNNLQNRINTENTNFEKRLAEQRELYGSEKTKLQDELRSLTTEVTGLRAERMNLLIPIDGLKEETEKLNIEAVERLNQIKIKEKELDDLTESTKKRLEFITDKKEEIESEEEEMLRKKKGIDDEAEMISKSHANLNKLIETFNLEVQKTTRNLSQRESIIEAKEKNCQDFIKSSEINFKQRESKLKDERDTLDRAWKELKAKQEKYECKTRRK